MTFEQNIGTRAQVWHGTAKKTSGGLTKTQLMMNKHGRIVSRRKHATAKRENRLVKAGFLTKKGQFGFIKKGSRKMRGGTGMPTGTGMPSNPQVAAMNGPNTSNLAASPAVIAKGLQPTTAAKTGGRRRSRCNMRGGSSHKMRGGGNGLNYALSPSPFDGKGVGTSGVAVQMAAGLGN
jgi:hypothetical protein